MSTKENLFDLAELPELYQEKDGRWLLLEVIQQDAAGNPVCFQLHADAAEKETLHEYLMDHEEWNWNKNYLMVKADPLKPCDVQIPEE